MSRLPGQQTESDAAPALTAEGEAEFEIQGTLSRMDMNWCSPCRIWSWQTEGPLPMLDVNLVQKESSKSGVVLTEIH